MWLHGGGGVHFGGGLWDFQNGVDLHINSKSPLGTSLLVNLVNISDDGQHKSCSLSYGLGWHDFGWPRLVEKSEEKLVQSGEENKIGTYDHYHMYVSFKFSFDLILVSLMQMCLFIIYKYSTHNRSSNGGLGWRFAILAKGMWVKMGFSHHLISLHLLWLLLTLMWFLLV